MRRGGGKVEALFALGRRRSFQTLLAVGVVYLVLVTFELPFVFSGAGAGALDKLVAAESLPRGMLLETKGDRELKEAPVRPGEVLSRAPERSAGQPSSHSPAGGFLVVSSLNFSAGGGGAGDGMDKAVKEAWEVGTKFWADLESGAAAREVELKKASRKRSEESCPHSISLTGAQFTEKGRLMVLPCGLTLGSHITLVGKPHRAHAEHDPKISTLKGGSQSMMVSQFRMELQGLKTVDGEDPPRILHFNPRLKGDWSGKPVIELNTCYRMQWGTPQRCEGWISKADEETVDGQMKCEKWIRDDDDHSESSKASWWLNRLIGRTKKVSVNWPFPFAEEQLFVLTLSAGLEGYHVSVDGRHITSFPYRTGFTLEDATGLSLIGDLVIQSIFAASLPTNHPSFAPQRYLQMSHMWKAPPLPDGPVELFIGILSAGNHFAERMAVRKSWMQSKHIKSSNVVARFFVALHGRKEVNVELKKEAEFFGDIVIVPFMDSYDLVVLKTVAICEYGVRAVSAKYTMKCDDDTFVRVDSVLAEARKIPSGKSFYIGNINYYHQPLRFGKWAVTYEEWPEEDYPPYANGPGYIVSSDIAQFVVSEFEKQTIRLFKMEDVSMGMWVERFNSTTPVQYIHDGRFYQSGCLDEYFTAHYQSPRQMLCLWDKLRLGKAQCSATLGENQITCERLHSCSRVHICKF